MKKTLLALGIVVGLILSGCSQKEEISGGGYSEGSNSLSQAASADETENTNSEAAIDESVPPMDEENFTPEQQQLIDLAKSFYIGHIELSDEITEVEKGDFFLFIISSSRYEDRAESWKREGDDSYPYAIPLSEVEEILFSRLDVQSFDPVQAFPQDRPARYDPERQELLLPMIGGYGGAAALGVLEYEEDADLVHIVLGSYDMNLFYSQSPSYVLIGTFEVTFSAPDHGQDYKVLKIKRN